MKLEDVNNKYPFKLEEAPPKEQTVIENNITKSEQKPNEQSQIETETVKNSEQPTVVKTEPVKHGEKTQVVTQPVKKNEQPTKVNLESKPKTNTNAVKPKAQPTVVKTEPVKHGEKTQVVTQPVKKNEQPTKVNLEAKANENPQLKAIVGTENSAEFNQLLQNFTSIHASYYDGVKGTKGHAHTQEEIQTKMAINKKMKKILESKSQNLANLENDEQSKQNLFSQISNEYSLFGSYT